MSSYVGRVRNERLGRETNAFFIDDFYGHHNYGVGIPNEDTDEKLGPWWHDKAHELALVFIPIEKLSDKGWEIV